jgi:ectoine hydroxylase-related dioxygenase (phytanoyl-CoA dioxygenase family)
MATQSNIFSQIEVEQYREDGLVVIRDFFEPSVVDGMRDGWEETKRGMESGAVQRSSRFVWGDLPQSIMSLYSQPVLVNAVQAILGEDIALYMNRVLLKDKEWSGAVAIHQDQPYFTGGINKVSAFVPLTRTLARTGNGGLIFLKGSHKYGNLGRGAIRRDVFPPMEEIAPDLEVGDVVLMDFLTWHYSEDAVVPGERPLLQIVYQPSSDGSYGSADLGVPSPTLVSGQWRTSYFSARGKSTIPD